jgi:hypothetical protein
MSSFRGCHGQYIFAIPTTFCERNKPMITSSHAFPRLASLSAAVAAVIITSACTPVASLPNQVAATNPSVTYNYTGDSELIEANRRAVTFCDPYQSTPQAASVTDATSGGKTVIFQCVKAPPPIMSQTLYSPNITTYRTDQDLLDASQSARIYCLNSGKQGLTSRTSTNASGVKTVEFACGAG